MTLDDLVVVVRRHLWMPDVTPLLVVLATVVANYHDGDPVWVLLVGPPSSGKTEILTALSTLPDIHEVSTFTKAGLLTGSISNSTTATGGLLAEVGKFGIVLCKDVTSLLSEASDTRAGIFAALREIYDGKWSRRVGSAGGQTLAWRGKLGFLGAVTETIDRHTTAIGAMGERFVFCRMPTLNEPDRLAQARVALGAAGNEPTARAELADAVRTFLTPIIRTLEATPLHLEVEQEWLILVADLATRCRSVVERDTRDRQVELVPQAEAIPRLVKVLAQLARGLRVISVPADQIPGILATIALDGLPKTRRSVIEQVVGSRRGGELTAAEIGDRIGLPTDAATRALEDLAAHGIVQRQSIPQGPHRWAPTEWLRERWHTLRLDVPNDFGTNGGPAHRK